MSIGREAYQLAYEISPILLQDGIATGLPANLLPIVLITEPASAAVQALGGKVDLNLNDYFAHFTPMPGSTLINNQIGMYPFANQNVAANAVIAEPLTVSMLMTAPVKGKLGYLTRTATLIVMQQILQKHIAQGGLFTVVTPASIYTSCILTSLRDVTAGESKQTQIMYQWDFIKPLVTQSDAQKALSTQTSKITAGLPP